MKTRLLFAAIIVVVCILGALAVYLWPAEPVHQEVSTADIAGTWFDANDEDDVAGQDFTGEMELLLDGSATQRSFLLAEENKTGTWNIVDPSSVPTFSGEETYGTVIHVAFTDGSVAYFGYTADGHLFHLSGDLQGQSLKKKEETAIKETEGERVTEVESEPLETEPYVPDIEAFVAEAGGPYVSLPNDKQGYTWRFSKVVEGKETVIFPNIQEKLLEYYTLESGQRGPRALMPIMPSADGDYWYFYASYPDSGAGYGKIFALNTTTHTLEVLKTASAYRTAWGRDAFAPGTPRFLSIGLSKEMNENDGREIYVVNLETETAKRVLTLQNTETVIESRNTYGGGPVITWTWVDEETIEISIFDAVKTVADEHGHLEHPLLRTERITVPK